MLKSDQAIKIFTFAKDNPLSFTPPTIDCASHVVCIEGEDPGDKLHDVDSDSVRL